MSEVGNDGAVDLVIVGAAAYDEIHSAAGDVEHLLGGSCVYAALGARFAARPAPVSVVGDDFDCGLLAPLREAGIGLEGIERAAGRTFRWACRYDRTGDRRETLYTEPGVYETRLVEFDEGLRDAPLLFLTAGNPRQNERALERMRAPRLIAVDTIEREIETQRAGLTGIIRRSQLVSINAHEAALLIGWAGDEEDAALPGAAAAQLRALGPETIVIKQGSQGVDVFEGNRRVRVSAVPGVEAVDPTGAGDAFTAALLSAMAGGADVVEAARWGCAVASFAVEAFGIAGLVGATEAGVRERLGLVVAEELAAAGDEAGNEAEGAVDGASEKWVGV